MLAAVACDVSAPAATDRAVILATRMVVRRVPVSLFAATAFTGCFYSCSVGC